MSLEHPLLGLAIVLTAGIVVGELFQRFRLPKVTGWIATGIALRALRIPGLLPEDLPTFTALSRFVLGYIAFTVGAAFHLASLRNAGRRLSLMVLTEAIITPTFVCAALVLIGQLRLAEALVLSAIAIAGAPGTTVVVVREARARGVFVKTLVAAVALIDVVAVVTFAFVSSLLRSRGEALELGTVGGAALAVVSEVGMATIIGVGGALLVLLLLRTAVGPAFLGPLMIALILASWGVAQAVQVSSILACTIAGMALTNLRHDVARAGEAYLHPQGGVLFAAFFTLAGMRLDFSHVLPAAGLVALFFLARLVGKSLSAFTAMSLAGMPNDVRRWLGPALLPHGGVAVGLVLLVEQEPSLASMHDTIAAVGLAALAINQLLGPSATKLALDRAGETNQDRPRLLDFLTEARIVVGLDGGSKAEVIASLAAQLYATTDMQVDRETFIERVLEREEEASTCLGEGFMIPHAVLPDGDEVRGVLGICREGMDLDAPDGRKVHAVVLLATPEAEQNRHLEVLAAFASAITRNANFREQLYSASSPARAYQILHADDATDFNYFLDETMAPSVRG